jgi:3-phosphoglycerate kinase
MIPGLSAHMPELIVFSDEQCYDVETYIQLYNCMGYLMQVEIEYIHKVIWNAKKPVMAIKSMAAGRITPFVGITFSLATIRPCDMVVVGCFTPEEVHEDVEIGLAAIERRAPNLEGRSSPNKTAAMGS